MDLSIVTSRSIRIHRAKLYHISRCRRAGGSVPLCHGGSSAVSVAAVGAIERDQHQHDAAMTGGIFNTTGSRQSVACRFAGLFVVAIAAYVGCRPAARVSTKAECRYAPFGRHAVTTAAERSPGRRSQQKPPVARVADERSAGRPRRSGRPARVPSPSKFERHCRVAVMLGSTRWLSPRRTPAVELFARCADASARRSSRAPLAPAKRIADVADDTVIHHGQ